MSNLKPKIGKADLHIHTNYSYDGISSPREVLEQASIAGLDVIAICDHEEIRGAQEAQKIQTRYNLEVIVGEEILTNEGEVIGLFLKEKIEPGKTLSETVNEIRRQGGLVVVPHPFSLFPLTRPAIGANQLYSMFKDKKILPDALEVLNSMPVGKSSAKRSKRINDNVFQVAEVAGSDAHIKNHIGSCVTLFEGKTSNDLKRAILSKQTTVKGDFISRKETTKVIAKNIVKVTSRVTSNAKNKVVKPYQKLKNKFKFLF